MSQIQQQIKGQFQDIASGHRHWIKRGSEQFPPAKDRYHLYINYSCPWAHRCLIVRNLKGLQDVIGLSVTHPVMQKTRENENHFGWIFGEGPYKNPVGYGNYSGENQTIDDPNLNSKFIRNIYEKVDNAIKGVQKFSVPILYDKLTNQIVNNESSEIIQMLNSEFNEFSSVPDLDLQPENLKDKVKDLDEDIFNNINSGVYKCGFCESQEAYDTGIVNLFKQLDICEEILSKQRYLAGDQLTLSDIKLWVSLLRFDEVYAIALKTNKKLIHQYQNLMDYCRDIYQYGNIKDTVKMGLIKKGYYGSKETLNYYGIIPVGCGFENMLKEKHNRDTF